MTIKLVGEAAPVADERLRGWLEEHQRAHPHLTSEVLARRIGVSRAQIDRYLAGKYFKPKPEGDGVNPATSKLESKIRKYRESIEGTERRGYKSTFMKTGAWFKAQKGIEIAINEKLLVIICGSPGRGKTKSITQFIVDNLTALVVRVKCSPNIHAKYFVQRLAQEVGGAISTSGSIAKIEDDIVAQLRKSPRPVIVDQANYLPAKSLGSCSYIWEEAMVPFVLFGTKDLYRTFTSPQMAEDERAQLASRVAVHYLLDDLSVQEVKTIATKVLGPAATDSVVAQVMKMIAGSYRALDNLLPCALELGRANEAQLASGEVTWEEIIVEAGSRLLIA
jgi:DNA transposition AAA+ family ATPase